ERSRDKSFINLICSENYPSAAVREALGAHIPGNLNHLKGTEGYPGGRFYGGRQHIDDIERLCCKRALQTFDLDPKEWGVNVQPLSGALANLYTYTALMKPGDKIMGLDLSHGGHISHGFQTGGKKVSEVAVRFESTPYYLNPITELIDYEELERSAIRAKPKILIAGASTYNRLIDYPRMRAISNKIGALLHSDIAHICGMIAAGEIPSPFPVSHVVTTTSLKTLRGPRAAMIFYRQEFRSDIDQTVFPRFQSGPDHRNTLALAVALRQAQGNHFKAYQRRVMENTKVVATALQQRGYSILSGGSDIHLLVLKVRDRGIDGAQLDKVLEAANVSSNRNAIPGDTSGFKPGGLRIGSAPMTTKGFGTAHFKRVADIIHQAVQLSAEISRRKKSSTKDEAKDSKSLSSFLKDMRTSEVKVLEELKQNVSDLLKGL
ncbi:glycine hydroxymethyltransferase, partial [Cadophora sp. DSE1049]